MVLIFVTFYLRPFVPYSRSFSWEPRPKTSLNNLDSKYVWGAEAKLKPSCRAEYNTFDKLVPMV